MADKDQRTTKLMSEINSISKEMGNNFATMFKGMMVLMFRDVTQGRSRYRPPCQERRDEYQHETCSDAVRD